MIGPILLYVRKSRALGDPDDPNLLSTMRSSLLALVAKDGHDPARARVIEEIGSGERIHTRPRFAALLTEWQRGAIKNGTVYVTELPRLTRGNLSDMARVQEALLFARFAVRTRKRLLDLTDDDDLEYWEDEILYGRRELRRIKSRFAAGKAELLRQGRLRSGSAPYGYRYTRDGKTLVVHADEFPVLQALAADALTLSLRRLAAKYHLPPARVWRTLTSPTICGYPARRKGMTEVSRLRAYTHVYLPRHEWTWPEAPGDWPAAITRQQFDQIQEALLRRFKERAKPGGDAGWCRDALVFLQAAAGAGPVRLGCHNNQSERTLTYEQEQPGKPLLYIPRATVHAAASDALQRLLTGSDAIACLIAAQDAQSALEGTVSGAARDLEGTRRQLLGCRRLLDELLVRELSAENEADAASIARVRREQLAEEARLAALVQEQERRPKESEQLGPLLPYLEAAAADWDGFWGDPDLDDRDRRRIVSALVERIEVETVKEKGRRAWRREVTAVVFREWLRA